jgi:hypothetical protein
MIKTNKDFGLSLFAGITIQKLTGVEVSIVDERAKLTHLA